MTGFADKPTLTGDRVLLRPIVAADANAMWADLHDEESRRLTGTHQTFERSVVEQWCATRIDQRDRLDMAVIDRATGAWAGEVVINELDEDNLACGYRIALGPGGRNRGLGTEATRMIVDHVFDTIDEPRIHRLELEVFAFNPRAMAVYEKVGFVREGVRRDALYWDGEFVDTVVMGIIRSDRERRAG